MFPISGKIMYIALHDCPFGSATTFFYDLEFRAQKINLWIEFIPSKKLSGLKRKTFVISNIL